MLQKSCLSKLKNNFLHQAKVPAPLIGIGTFALRLFYSNFLGFWVFAIAASRSFANKSRPPFFQNTGGSCLVGPLPARRAQKTANLQILCLTLLKKQRG